MNRHLNTDFPAVRRVMGSERHRLDDDALEEHLAELFPGVHPEDVEDFMGSLQTFGRKAAPVAQRALPGAIQGAAQGATVAGPWGALAGAVGGGAASLLPGRRPAAPPPAGAPTGPAPSPTAEPLEPPPGPPTAATAATAQLLALLSRPETMQALLALLLSASGRNTIQVGQGQVRPAAFANAIAETAALVAEAAAQPLDEPVRDYLFDAAGHPRADVADPAARAALLLSDLAAVAAAEALEDQEDFREASDEEADAGDPLEGYEAALQGMAADEC